MTDKTDSRKPHLYQYAKWGALVGFILTICSLISPAGGGESPFGFIIALLSIVTMVPSLLLSRLIGWKLMLTSDFSLPLFGMMLIVNVLLWGLFGLLVAKIIQSRRRIRSK